MNHVDARKKEVPTVWSAATAGTTTPLTAAWRTGTTTVPTRATTTLASALFSAQMVDGCLMFEPAGNPAEIFPRMICYDTFFSKDIEG